VRQRGSGRSCAQAVRDFFPFGDGLGRDLDEAFGSDLTLCKLVHRDAVAGAGRLLAGGIGDRAHRRVKMFAVARKREADEVAWARGILVAQAVVGKVVYLIIAETENGNRLARARFLRAVSLVEQRGVPSIGAERNGRGKA